MSGILWVIGAGASLHLGFPLLRDFTAFFETIWNFKDTRDGETLENRQLPEIAEVLPWAIDLMKSPQYRGKNIEQILNLVSADDNRRLKKAIRVSFERRNIGRLFKLIPSSDGSSKPKLDLYGRLLCLLQRGDKIVDFNYDNAIEIVMSLVHGDYSTLDLRSLSVGQKAAMKREGLNRWVSPDCVRRLSELRCALVPASGVFDSTGEITIGSRSEEFFLIKIHGSINWFLSPRRLVQVGEPDQNDYETVIIYPESDKSATSEEPYCRIMDEAVRALSDLDVMVVIGYSIPESDSENHPFVKQLLARPPKRLVIVDPNPSESIVSLAKRTSATVIRHGLERLFDPDFKVDQRDFRLFIDDLRSTARGS